MPSFTESLARIGDVSVSFAPTPAAPLSDSQLVSAQRKLAEVQRRVQTQAAIVASEIAYRSRRELGHGGLAADHGSRTAEQLISTLAGTSTRDARALVKAGALVPPEIAGTQARAVTDAPPPSPWEARVGAAVASAAISVEAAGVIRSRLGEAAKRMADSGGDPRADDHVTSELVAAAERLIAAAPALTIEQLAARASRERDELDIPGVAARDDARRDRRFLRVATQLDGMTRVSALLDPESAAIVVPILDAATSPRRGGPRFVDPDAALRADDIVRDTRTTEQLAVDTFVELLRIGSRADDGTLLGDKKPAVRVLVTQRDLDATPDAEGVRAGAAYFEAQTEPVPISTAERYICAGGAIPILFDDDTGRVLNLGRRQRLFSDAQRVALAARDGGCRMCGRPPSWCEAHHIDHWDEHLGRTDIDDGVLLCRHCHLLTHNRGWRIRRREGRYYLDRPGQQPTPLPARSPAAERLLVPA